MLKFVAILSAVIVVVVCKGHLPLGGRSPPKGHSQPKGQSPPKGDCKACDSTIKKAFELVSSVGKGMEPMEMKDISVCQKITITIGPSTMGHHGKSCMITEPKPSKVRWQQTGFVLKKLHIECHIVPLKDFGKALGLPTLLPLPKKNKQGSTKKREEIIVVDGKDLVFDFVSKINFEDDICNVTKLEMAKGKLDTIQVSLKGDSLFTKLGALLTKQKPVRVMLGVVVQIVLRVVMRKCLDDPSLKEVITMLNCGDTDY